MQQWHLVLCAGARLTDSRDVFCCESESFPFLGQRPATGQAPSLGMWITTQKFRFSESNDIKRSVTSLSDSLTWAKVSISQGVLCATKGSPAVDFCPSETSLYAMCIQSLVDASDSYTCGPLNYRASN